MVLGLLKLGSMLCFFLGSLNILFKIWGSALKNLNLLIIKSFGG